MPLNETRILLDESISPEIFRRTAASRGWILRHEYEPSDDTTYEVVYTSGSDQTTSIHYIEDQFVMVRYVLVRGAQTPGVVSTLKGTFDYYDDAVVLERAEQDGDLQERIDWLMSATVLGDQAGRDRLVSLINRRSRCDNPGVRRAALIAASWLEWPELREFVEALAVFDPNPEVQTNARRLASAYALRDLGKL